MLPWIQIVTFSTYVSFKKSKNSNNFPISINSLLLRHYGTKFQGEILKKMKFSKILNNFLKSRTFSPNLSVSRLVPGRVWSASSSFMETNSFNTYHHSWRLMHTMKLFKLTWTEGNQELPYGTHNALCSWIFLSTSGRLGKIARIWI